MDPDLSRKEYPALLTSLQPLQAVTILNERVKRIGRVNTEIADWLAERRKVEEAYVQGLRKLSRKEPPNSHSELGIFTAPWQKITASADALAQAHHTFSQRIQKDVEQSLRDFPTKNREMQSLSTMQGNLGSMAKELDDAQEQFDKLNRKGGRASSKKVDSALQRLEQASSMWESQAPAVFELLQACDESRLNHLRDFLTQYQTHEADQVERSRIATEQTLSSLLEIDTAAEIANFSVNAGQGKRERKPRPTPSAAGSSTFIPPPATPTGQSEDGASEHSGRNDGPSESKGGLRRLGTMISRRRQSVHGGFARAPSPTKFGSFSRSNTGSRGEGSFTGRPSPSPRASYNNLRESVTEGRLSSLAESPTPAEGPGSHRPGANGTNHGLGLVGSIEGAETANSANGAPGSEGSPMTEFQPPPGPPPSQTAAPEPRKDSEGYTIPAAMDDPISLAQAEALEETNEPQFKLDIRNEPIREEDSEAARAALSNVANTLRSNTFLGTPNRKVGTTRGRRDVRNTMYVPSPPAPSESFASQDSLTSTLPPPSPGFLAARATGSAPKSTPDHMSASATSDTQSIRSSHSVGNTAAIKHPEMHGTGLNSSIVESVSAYMENGAVKTVAVIGEVALSYNNPDVTSSLSSVAETIRLTNFPALEAIAPNHAFVQELPATGLSDTEPAYTLETSHLPPSRPVVAFKYKVHINDANASSHVPILITPTWKSQGDKLGVIVEYRLNPEFSAAVNGAESVHVSGLVIQVNYEGRAAGCQTKPSGTHVKDKSMVYWRLGDVDVMRDPRKLVGRLVGAPGTEPKPGLVEARWEVAITAPNTGLDGSEVKVGSGLGISRLEAGKGKEKEEAADPFADEDSVTVASAERTDSPAGHWVALESVRRLMNGSRFEAREVSGGEDMPNAF